MSKTIDFRLKCLFALGHMHWIPFGVERVINQLFNRGQGEDVDFITDFYGFAYEGTLRDYIDQSVFFYGAYTGHELALIREALAFSKGHFYDIGANVGHHALFASRYADRVIAFEPLEVLRAKIAQKMETNHVQNVEVFSVALSDVAGTAKFFLPQGANQGGGSLMLVNANREDRFVEVEVCRGDDFIVENTLPPAAMLKIDVEGNEARVLAGMGETLNKDRPVVLMELSEAAREVFKTEDGLRKLLYPRHDIFEIHPRRFGRGYKLGDFSFEKSGEILVLPSERNFVKNG